MLAATLNIEVVVIDPNSMYSSEYSESEASSIDVRSTESQSSPTRDNKSAASSQESSPSPQDMQPINLGSGIRYGIGKGKDFSTLTLCNDKSVSRKAKASKSTKAEPVKQNDVRPAKVNGAKPTKENVVEPSKETVVKLMKDTEGKLRKISEKRGKSSCAQITQSTVKKSRKIVKEVNNNLDDFTKAIVASIEESIVQRKPNLEKRRNRETRNRLSHFKDHSDVFQKYLSDRRVTSKNGLPQPLTLQNNNHLLTVGSSRLAENENTGIEQSRPERSDAENYTPGNSAGTRKITIQEYLSRKKLRQSTNDGPDVDTGPTTKKRISIAEYLKRKGTV